MSGIVYFLQCGEGGPIKVGHTICNVYNRVAALQQSSPHELKWVGFFYGPRAAETAAHQRLAKHRLRNEWFHPTPEVLAFIEEKCPRFDPKAAREEILCEPERQAVKSVLAQFKYRKNGYVMGWRIARDAGVSYQDLCMWTNESRPLDRDDVRSVLVAAVTFDQMSKAAA